MRRIGSDRIGSPCLDEMSSVSNLIPSSSSGARRPSSSRGVCWSRRTTMLPLKTLNALVGQWPNKYFKKLFVKQSLIVCFFVFRRARQRPPPWSPLPPRGAPPSVPGQPPPRTDHSLQRPGQHLRPRAGGNLGRLRKDHPAESGRTVLQRGGPHSPGRHLGVLDAPSHRGQLTQGDIRLI